MIPPLLSTLLTLLLIPSSLACLPHTARQAASASYPSLTIGSDGPADPSTLGYTIGHFALLVNDLTATRHFYGTVLGMRHIFTYNASAEYTIMYMGHSQGGKNGTGFMSGEDMFAEVYNMEGLIEFIEFKNSSNARAYATGPTRSFSHFGLVVPDISAAQSRMESFGVTILKNVGAAVIEDGEVALAFGIPPSGAESEAAVTGLEDFGFAAFMVIADPDGNVIEVLPAP